jgi:hypothetical protein
MTLEQIHDAFIKFGISEYNFFLGFKAAELLLKHEKEEEIRLKMRPPPFGRTAPPSIVERLFKNIK